MLWCDTLFQTNHINLPSPRLNAKSEEDMKLEPCMIECDPYRNMKNSSMYKSIFILSTQPNSVPSEYP